RLFLADRSALGLSRQRADLSRVLRTRRRRRARADGPARHDARGDLHGRGLYGRHDLYRQSAESHDLCHRRRAWRENAGLVPLYGWVGGVAAAGVRRAYFRFGRARRLTERAERVLPAALAADLDAALARAAAGSTATASISINAPSRASPEIAMVVLAGRSFLARYPSRASPEGGEVAPAAVAVL